jgi:hypothetical protein
MDKRRQTPADKVGYRNKRMKRQDEDAELEARIPQSSSWRPSDDVFGDDRKMSRTVDTDLDFEGRFGKKK